MVDRRRLPLTRTWLLALGVAGLSATACCAQGLDKFSAGNSREDRVLINKAIDQCVRMIQQKTADARISIKGPCRNRSGEWVGVEKSDAGVRLRFTVTPAGSSAGTLLSALQGDAVRVFCGADNQGAITTFEDVKEGVGESFKSAGLCWPAGD